MTPGERRARWRAILDQHDAAIRQFNDTGDAIRSAARGVDDALVGIRRTILAIEESLATQKAANAAVLAANAAALALFNDEEA